MALVVSSQYCRRPEAMQIDEKNAISGFDATASLAAR
jgi:hypothetical protein